MRRLLPLLAPFAVSAALAAGFQAGLGRTVAIEAPPRPILGTATLTISMTSGERRINCPTTVDRASADVLELNPEDLEVVSRAICN